MIKQWEFIHFPCQKDPCRYKLKVKAQEEDLPEFIRKLGVQCGRPFVSLSKDFNWAFYLYHVEKDDRNRIIAILKEFSDKGLVNSSTLEVGQELPPVLEEILDETARLLLKEEKDQNQQTETGETARSPEPAESVGSSQPVESAQTPEPAASADPVEAAPDELPQTAEPKVTAGEIREHFPEVKLNKRYIFENFVVGPNNRFTHAAAQAVAKNPGKIYNPLFIYGGVGLGKTHLMHAVGHYVLMNSPSVKLLFITTEKFMVGVIDAIGSGSMLTFREQFKDVDVLLIDDIQFLSESEATQEEFFHIFNLLHQNNNQIIITSDRPPKQLMTLEDRLRSRFEWGLIADIKSPNLETRVAILKKKISKDNSISLDENILLYIASKLKSNIRELEGFLKRINAYAELTGKEVNIELVKSIMKELLPEEEFEETKPAEVQPPVQAPQLPAAAPPAEPPATRPVTIGFSMPPPSAPPVNPPSSNLKKPAGSGLTVSKLSGEDADPTLMPIEVGFFYPEHHENEFAVMKEKFKMIIKKHKLKFRLDPVFEKSYPYAGKINYAFFTETCKANNVRIMVALSPPPDAKVIEDDFANLLSAVMEDDRVSLQLVLWQEKEKDYRYLNLSLDITLLRHRKPNK